MPKGIIALRKEDFDGLRYGKKGHSAGKSRGVIRKDIVVTNSEVVS